MFLTNCVPPTCEVPLGKKINWMFDNFSLFFPLLLRDSPRLPGLARGVACRRNAGCVSRAGWYQAWGEVLCQGRRCLWPLQLLFLHQVRDCGRRPGGGDASGGPRLSDDRSSHCAHSWRVAAPTAAQRCQRAARWTMPLREIFTRSGLFSLSVAVRVKSP